MKTPNSPLTIFGLVGAFVMVGACDTESSISGAVVEKLSPAPGQTNVAPTTVIRVELQDRPNRDHLENKISVHDELGRPVSGTVHAEAYSLIFVPDNPLVRDRNYQVCIADLKTTDGQLVSGYRFDPELGQVESFGGRYCYHFSTKATLDITRKIFDPAASALRIYFSDAVATDSLNGLEVVAGSNSQALDTRIRYSPGLFRLTIILDRDTRIQDPIVVTLPATVQSRDGHLLSHEEGDNIVFESSQSSLTDQ